MKNLTTLSLITASIIGLTGCGGPAGTQNEVTSGNINIEGIPQEIIAGTCQDVNANYICDDQESSSDQNGSNKTFAKTVRKVKVKNPNRILVLLKDPKNVHFNNGEFKLAFDSSKASLDLFDEIVLDMGDILWNPDSDVEHNEKSRKVMHNILSAIEENLNTFGDEGVVGDDIQQENLKAIKSELDKLNLEDIIGSNASALQEECGEDQSCIDEILNSIKIPLTITRDKAIAIAEHTRDNYRPITRKILENFKCEANENLRVAYYGAEDNFSSFNGVEVAHPSTQLSTHPTVVNYGGNGLSNYDFHTKNTLFGEEIKNLPNNITKARFLIGLESHGGNDTLSIGNYDNNSSTDDIFSTNTYSLSWANNAHVYYQEFSNITLNDGSTLLDFTHNHSHMDVFVQDDTYVDFITVAMCVPKDPLPPIHKVVDNFTCSEKEQLVKLIGGEIDAFANGADTNNPATPSSTLSSVALNNTVYPNLAPYDYDRYNHHFVDTLTNGMPTGTITKAQFNIGYRGIGSSLVGNDTVTIGDYMTNHSGGHLYSGASNPITSQGWQTFNIPMNGETIAQVDLADLNNTLGTETIQDTLNNMLTNRHLDVYVQDDTAVDFTQLNLCVYNNCNESAKVYDINLSQLTNWTFRPADAAQNNVFNNTQYEGVWDNTIEWFDFNNSHSDEILEIPFCACSNTIVNINNLKADNSATIKLDGTLVASQQGYDQEAMKRDDMGGNHVDGSLTLPAGVNGGVNHVLRVDVHNLGDEFGVAIDGTLKFKGHLGKCE